MGSIDWGEGLPLGVLSQVASGRCAQLSDMREANKTWQQGFDGGVTKLTVTNFGPLLPHDLAERFLELAGLDIGRCPMEEAGLQILAGLKKLTSLSLGCGADEFDIMHQEPLARRLTDEGLENLRGLPLTDLSLECCSEVTDAGLACLRGMPLVKLSLGTCAKLSNSGLENLVGMPLVSLNLGRGESLTDPGLEFLRGLPLTELSLWRCSQITSWKNSGAGPQRQFDQRHPPQAC